MIDDIFLSTALFAALLVYMIDYGIGKPGDEKVNYKALLFIYTFFISKITLKKFGLWNDLELQYREQMDSANSLSHRHQIQDQFKEMVFQTARPFFTWQSVVGMCPICFHFWLNIIFLITVNYFVQKVNIITFGLHLGLGHLFIRALKKYF